MNGQNVNVNERLSKLEEELDQLISLQEKIKKSKANNLDYGGAPQYSENKRQDSFQQCVCTNTVSCARPSVEKRQVLAHCTAVGGSAPLADITKFLQHINLNLFKGTQAITKIAKSTSQSRTDGSPNSIFYPESCLKKTETPNGTHLIHSHVKKVDEDALYKDLRDEKDKRQRAENQVKQIKEELKVCKIEHQRIFDSKVLQLQDELREALDKLTTTKQELVKRNQECQHAEYVWPYKYDTVCKELQEERAKRSEVERNVQQMQEMLRKCYVNSDELFTLQKTASRLKDQNESLICLSKKLRSEVEEKAAEVCRKNQTIEENFRKIKQLTCLCEKLRDFLIVVRQRASHNQEQLTENQQRSQRLTDKLLEAQSSEDRLKAAQERDRLESNRLAELVSTLTAANSALQTRVEEMSEIMIEQTRLIARQSGTISVKENQLRLASENNELLSQKLAHLEKNNNPSAHGLMSMKSLENQVDRVKMDLENKTEMLLIKEKIIESHLQSISEMKGALDRKEEEINHKRKEMAEIERKREIEKTTTEQLHCKVKSLLSQKEELRKTIEQLEEELENQVSSEEAGRLEQIEKQVKDKQKEWEEGKSVLIREKEKVLEALRCTSQKLAARTTEFQVETSALQLLVDKLTVELKEKNAMLEEATEKISTLTREIKEADQKATITKRSYEEKVESACEAWKQTMALLQTDN